MKNLTLSIVLIVSLILLSSIQAQNVDADGVGTPVYTSIPTGTVVFFAPTAAEFSEDDAEQIQAFMGIVQNAMEALEMENIPSMITHDANVTFTNSSGAQISLNLRTGPSRMGAMLMIANSGLPKSLYGVKTVQEIVSWAKGNE
jgi:hypothetical protein